jgi:hypothetical protein
MIRDPLDPEEARLFAIVADCHDRAATASHALASPTRSMLPAEHQERTRELKMANVEHAAGAESIEGVS